MEQILLEAQNRWLRPSEICEILRNYHQFRIAPQPPNKPPSGSLFLFDRKETRYFRKDYHNWRKKKDGKTVKEAHERLKADSVDVLHCYYAHGEENENFQRRCYWLLDESHMHIVLVHYLEIKGNRTSYSRPSCSKETSEAAYMAIPCSSTSLSNPTQSFSHTMDTESPSSTHITEYEDKESDNHQASSRYHPVPAMQWHEDGLLTDVDLFNVSTPSTSIKPYFGHRPTTERGANFYSVSQDEIAEVCNEDGSGFTIRGPRMTFDFPSWEKVVEHSMSGFQDESVKSSLAMGASINADFPEQETTSTEFSARDSSLSQVNAIETDDMAKWQFHVDKCGDAGVFRFENTNGIPDEDRSDYPSLLKQRSIDLDGEGLKKYDSFSKWMSKELGEVDGFHLNSSSEAEWITIESGNALEDPSASNQEQLGAYLVGPSLSQEQLFSIIDFSPNWAYSGLQTKVLVTGIFLKSKNESENCKWSCMFGQVEVVADVVADGTLRCCTPPHRTGRFPFYITISNRLACSEVREFEFREQQKEVHEVYGYNMNEIDLFKRFEKLVLLETVNPIVSGHDLVAPLAVQDDLNQELMKDEFRFWFISKFSEDSKSLCAFDEKGQCVLHLASALGYDWAIECLLNYGVNANFRDFRGWTALHWAASCGRERTVGFLVTLGAAPGALTDPTPEFPLGCTPADLAAFNGHKGIAGFLAEASLTTHLSTLILRESGPGISDFPDQEYVENSIDKSAFQISIGDSQADRSFKESQIAVRTASLAAARIHQVFRIDSFHRKKRMEIGDKTCGMSEERVLSLISVKHAMPGHYDAPAHVAAIRIQNNFRSWKGRKEFLITRQRIIKIQAHVRGYQVRKHYKKIVWSVGILEKVILRWRRRGSGFRKFRTEGLLQTSMLIQNQAPKDEYDFLREGRKQTEARLDKALARVISMARYPEARDQYRRLLTFVAEGKESKSMQVMRDDPNDPKVAGDFMMEL